MPARKITAAAFLILLVYAALPTRNYYWDGVSFAIAIETFPGGGNPILHPNHLLYSPIGYTLWHGLRFAGFDIRALYVLQALNALLAALAAWVLMRLLFRATGSLYVSLCLGAVFAFSARWWRFATDADAYIPSVLCLVLAFAELLRPEPRPGRVALPHAAAMLVHQLAVFFFPAAVAGLAARRGWRAAARYAAVAGGIALGGYYAGYLLDRPRSSFPAWLTNHASDAAFGFNPLKGLAASALSYVRLLFGGRLSLATQFFDPFTAVCIAAFAAAVAALAAQAVRGWGTGKRREVASFPGFRVALVWIGSYAAFLFFWLPQNTFYKLFLLPPLIWLAAGALASRQGPRFYRLALFTAAIALANLTLFIYPYAHAEANAPLAFARRIGGQWSGRTVVYYAAFSPDDWFIRYFNPETMWKPLENNPDGPVRDRAAGYDVWLDTTAVGDGPATVEEVAAGHRLRFRRYP